jgi:hypothetical protein
MNIYECINGNIYCKFCNKQMRYTNDICSKCNYILNHGLQHEYINISIEECERPKNIYIDEYLETKHIYSKCVNCFKYKPYPTHTICPYFINKINKIKRWYKKRKYNKNLYHLVEWIEKKRMNPESKYFKNIVEKFYE